MFLHEVIIQLNSFVENGFLKTLFDKSPQIIDKIQLLVETFGECANPNNFSIQNRNVPPDDKLFASISSSNTKTILNPVLEIPPILPDIKMISVDQTVTPENSWKKDK
uniref:Uncharacterized protein n=1 Tax=Rhizophagus irregularis (strain DAOM 181602 / DAOM 197198 / MUCL 43194) TaxID=747089 RepID=U9T688_RHIID